MTLYKILDEDRNPIHGGSGQYPPPGKWTELRHVDMCCSGYHLVDREHLIDWLGSAIWEAEGRGEPQHRPDKTAYPQVRLIRRIEAWNMRTLRLFATDCAEHVLPIYEREYPDNIRPRRAIVAVRLVAWGDVSQGTVEAAAEAAAEAATQAARAAEAAARTARSSAAAAAEATAARAAARAAWAARAMRTMRVAQAAQAARVARAAARAARAVAIDTEYTPQTTRLNEYLDGRVDLDAIRTQARREWIELGGEPEWEDAG